MKMRPMGAICNHKARHDIIVPNKSEGICYVQQ